MTLSSEIAEIERAAIGRSVSIRSILKRAGLANSNWARWKKGKTSPSLKTWAEVTTAADALLNAPNTPSPDSTADRVPGSSLSPIPDIARSPPSDAGQTASGEEEVRGDNESSSSDPQSVTPVGVEPVS